MATSLVFGNKTLSVLVLIVLAALFIFPLSVFSQGVAVPLVPCDGPNCEFKDLVQLAKNIINFLILLSIPLAAIAFAVAGFIYITAGGDESKIKKAHELFKMFLTGFLIILTSWLVVYLITTVLLNPGYNIVLEGLNNP